MNTFKKLTLVSALSLSFIAPEVMADTTWNVSLWGKRRAFTENVEKLAELVEQKTNGEFKMNISYGGLSKAKENLDGISFGAFEMAQFCAFYHAGKNPTITVNELPFSQDVSLARVAEIYTKVYQHPIVKKDMARWNATLLMPTPLPQYNLVAKGDVLTKLEDFDGQRTRGPGGVLEVLTQFGAIKTGVPFSEVRQSMDSGVIDAAAFAPHAHLATNTTNIGTWATTNLNLGSGDCPVVMNTEAFEDLKPAYRKVLLESVPEAMAYYVENYNTNAVAGYEKALQEHEVTKVTFTPAQTAMLDKVAELVRKDWVLKYEKQFDSQALLAYTTGLFKGE
ncbi:MULTISPECIES: TRAP transporter substrate-binding protein DctP [unclassified Oceanobacter]|uniref:TRAP transporter substrate-binding protein DctP n=1 Tax=unclassified Oceanobacter TaxID=2620260 RepID=UPI0026E20BC6|nr:MULTISPECIES: TRAP transporter substrate-binding protein DctP [unclassified Oceanobacter]MDO6682200.1 TRAP transporter substrate-binding protein DctP [Oceanobacter sp. 5_MG-2023]MDP2504933.1 TRAP transporter substrate-binding protein DctP [Oceanobacter sp. 3_MG-2023]MDP2546377.1 TRAP transporter substrate-binding protein DctP [Oceanobacter sp. 4_MG-2023]MDP2610433.1 TRAP transporter substrate-binding protein DctP [Oceanobacter sp. 1_MG-2023]MDP2613669.1 TRAP transporter substrate-binding pr